MWGSRGATRSSCGTRRVSPETPSGDRMGCDPMRGHVDWTGPLAWICVETGTLGSARGGVEWRAG